MILDFTEFLVMEAEETGILTMEFTLSYTMQRITHYMMKAVEMVAMNL